MNHIWTDKEINNAVKRLQKYRSCKHGLVVKHIKSGNIPAQDWRNLMFMLVERGHAFDNGENHETDNYQISINWDKQNEIFKPFFPPALLLHRDIRDLPTRGIFVEYLSHVERELGRPINQEDKKKWIEIKYKWLAIYEILCRFQTTGKFEIRKDHDFLKLGEHNKKYLILRAKEAAYMYKAIEYGCMHKCIVLEHSDKPVETVAIELFVDLLSFNSMSEFIAYCLHPGSSNPRAEPDHIRNFIKSCQNIKELSSKPVPDGEHDFDVYYYELNETEKDFVKTVNLMNKNISPRLLDFVVKIDSAPNSPTFYLRKLLDSSIPEVVEKAQMWADAALNGEDLKITQGAIRRYAKQRRSENPK